MTSEGFNWRYAFGIGSIIAVVGFVARITLKESAEFVNAKSRILKANEEPFLKTEIEKQFNKKIDKKTAFSLFLIQCAYPVSLYVTYIYSADILKNNFGYSSADVIKRNLLIAFSELINGVFCVWLSYRVCTLKIMRICLYVTFLATIFFAFTSKNLTPNILFVFQLLITLFAVSTSPGTPIFLKYFPILKRFTTASFLYAFSRAVMYIITSFGLVYLVNIFHYIGIVILMIPVLIGYHFGLRHFEKLEKVY
jgi:predicted MFS family arabinose efflux permease